MDNIENLNEITPEDSVVPVYLVPLTEEQIAEREAMALQLEADRIAAEQKESELILAKQSAITKLAALGLTEEEAKAIVGV